MTQLPRESFRILRESWFAYVDVERKKDGMGWDGTCQRDGVATAGRVEPPTPTGLLRAKPRHSTYLAHCWMAFLRGKIIPETSTAQYQTMISLVQNSCPTLLISGSVDSHHTLFHAIPASPSYASAIKPCTIGGGLCGGAGAIFRVVYYRG
jgi:hypothetical protein